jgi:hypothetical protein
MKARRSAAGVIVVLLTIVAAISFLYGVPSGRQIRRETLRIFRLMRNATGIHPVPVLSGELGALLRREGLYSSHLVNWRRQRAEGALRDLRARRRGPTPRPVDPRVKQLEAENRRLQRKLPAGGDDHHTPKNSCRDPGDPPETLDIDESD